MPENFVYPSEFRATSRPTGKLDMIEEAFHAFVRDVQTKGSGQERLLLEVDKSLDELRYAKGCPDTSVHKVREAAQKILDLTNLFHRNAEKLASLVNRSLPVPQNTPGGHAANACKDEG